MKRPLTKGLSGHPVTRISSIRSNIRVFASTQAELKREAILSRTASAIAQTVVEREAGFAKGQSVPEVLTLLRLGRSDDCILEVATEYKADLIVLGSHGHQGLDSLFHLSVAESVRKQAACPCLVLYPGIAP